MRKVNRRTSEGVYDDAGDESSDRIRQKHERKREHDASALASRISDGDTQGVERKLTGSRTKPSPAVCTAAPAPCAISDLYRKIDTKDVTMLRTEHEIATKPPIRAILSSSGRVMSVTDALRMMAD